MFSGKSIVVTGAGRGMGKCIAAAFAAKGAAVALVDMDSRAAEAAAAELRADDRAVLAVGADVRNEASVAAAMARVRDELGGLDILVNAAGGYGEVFRKSHETPEDEWDMVLDSNLKGTFLCSKHAIPIMIRGGGGRILNFSSNAGRTVSPLLGCSYTAAKAGVIGLTRHLSREYARDGILVNTIAPGPVSGDRLADLLDTKGMESLAEQIPLGRLAQPDDIVGVVLFLASDAAKFMTGAILDVNGGYVLA